jgi:Fe-S-cluster containining protein
MNDKGGGEDEHAGSIDDPAYQQAVFKDAYELSCRQLADTDSGLKALGQINKGRNEAVDELASDFASEYGAECGSGCSFCCHQMVLCTPFEVFDIARLILDTKPSAEIARIRQQLAKLAMLPLDVPSHKGADKPCALLEDNRCSIYEHRPSLCRTMLSTSRAACETSLNSQTQTVPFISEPVIISFLMQLGIDYALIKLKNMSTEKVEMSRALSIALDHYDAAFQNWIDGTEPFPDCTADMGSGPSSRALAERAAAQSGLA